MMGLFSNCESCSLTPQKHPSIPGNEDLKETSRPSSMTSNSSFHSTQDEFDPVSPPPSAPQDGSGPRAPEDSEGGKEEIRLLRQALENVQVKLLETRKENRSLHAQLKPERGRERDEYESLREKGREAELMESLAELQAKLTDTQERYHQAVEEVEELRARLGRGEGEQEVHRRTASTLEHEVKQLTAQLLQTGSELEQAGQRVRQLEEALRRAEEERRGAVHREERSAHIEELHKEAQEEIRALQVEYGAGLILCSLLDKMMEKTSCLSNLFKLRVGATSPGSPKIGSKNGF